MPLDPVPGFPTSLDTLPDPTSTTYTDDDGFELDLLLQKHNAILELIEAILGTGITTSYGVMRKIAEVTVSSPVATIDFTNIPQTYRHLMLESVLTKETTSNNILMRLSSDGTTFDTGSNYDWQFASASAATVTSAEQLAGTSLLFGRGSAATDVAVPAVTHLQDYTNTAKQKTVLGHYTGKDGTATGNMNFAFFGGFWRNTAAVKGIRLLPASGNFGVSTRVTLYGLPT